MAGLRSDNGFSLIETLVATFLLALVSASGVMLLSSYQDGRLSLKRADDRLAELELARSMIRDDMFAAIVRPVRDEYGSDNIGFQGGDQLLDNKVLRFVRGGNQGAKVRGYGSGLDRVEYIFEDGSLLRRKFDTTDITLETEFSDRLLLSGLEALELRFEAYGIWALEWGAFGETDELPGLVELTARYPDGQALSMTFMVGVQS